MPIPALQADRLGNFFKLAVLAIADAQGDSEAMHRTPHRLGVLLQLAVACLAVIDMSIRAIVSDASLAHVHSINTSHEHVDASHRNQHVAVHVDAVNIYD